jgi:hypothetical protein
MAEFFLVVLQEAEFEDEFTSADEFLVDLLPIGDHGLIIIIIAK